MSGRYVLVDNQSNEIIDIYFTPNNNPMYKVGTLHPNHAIRWEIPNGQYSGNFRKDMGANATLAEFTFNGFPGGVTDNYDISSIPPGCPGFSTSYQQCVQLTGKTGWNFPVRIEPTDSSCATLVCNRPGCVEAFGFPMDNGKQRTCDNTTEYHLVFGTGVSHRHYPRRVRTFDKRFGAGAVNGKCYCPEEL
jgi:hypothetical protein